MRQLSLGMSGPDVKTWQFFLIGQGVTPGQADGVFGPQVFAATKAFQEKHGLSADGKVGPQTMGKALMLGYAGLPDEFDNTILGPNWPPPPAGIHSLTLPEKRVKFGTFRYRADPQPGNPEHVVILDNWTTKNLISIRLPVHLPGAPASDYVTFHQLVAPHARGLFKAWEDEGLLHLIKTWGGSFVPRFTRGSKVLSPHAFGSAFDINVAWNQLGVQPALKGELGSVRELVPLANEHGFFWGGHFKRRLDGMHFEYVR